MNQWSKGMCQLGGVPSVSRSGGLLSQGGSCDGAQIGSASRQTTEPNVTWGNSLSISPKAEFFIIFLNFPGKRKWAGWSSSKRTENRKHLCLPVLVSSSGCGCGCTQLLGCTWSPLQKPKYYNPSFFSSLFFDIVGFPEQDWADLSRNDWNLNYSTRTWWSTYWGIFLDF